MSFKNLRNKSKGGIEKLRGKLDSEKRGGYGDDRIWQPTKDKAGNSFAVVRFLPEPENEEFPYVKVFSHGFQHGSKWFIENCPTTLGGECPVCDANNELWNTGLEGNKNIARKRKRKVSYYSNILVIKDSAAPENEGKVFLFRYGAKIYNMISEAINPEFEDETPLNPFDFWEGANFLLKVRMVEGYPNYDKSSFEEPSELFDGDEKKLEALWKKEYSLAELIAPEKFKSEDELRKAFNRTVNGGVVPVPEGDDGEEEEERKPRRSTNTADRFSKDEETPPFDVDPPASEDDDDGLSMYRAMLNGDD